MYQTPNSPEWEPLLAAAWAARSHAHAPYSHFQVGAALSWGTRALTPGCNVENASYPLCLCAERTALCAAVAQGMQPGQPLALVVVTDAEALTPPCGACRQALVEFADDLPILLANGTTRSLHQLRELLPLAFTSRNLTEDIAILPRKKSLE